MASHPNRSRRMDAPYRSPTGAEIRALRESVGLTTTAFAARLGRGKRIVEMWESGTVRMHPTLWRLAQAVCSGAAEAWITRAHPGDWIHGGDRRLSWQMRELLLEAYRAGQLSSE